MSGLQFSALVCCALLLIVQLILSGLMTYLVWFRPAQFMAWRTSIWPKSGILATRLFQWEGPYQIWLARLEMTLAFVFLSLFAAVIVYLVWWFSLRG